jgi:nucleoid-associated protein YgaU
VQLVTDSSSRYSRVGTAIWRSPQGATVCFYQRRFLPEPGTAQVLTRVKVDAGQRLDQIAAATLGNPLQWWRIADANAAMDPSDLTTVPGRVLIIPVPKA